MRFPRVQLAAGWLCSSLAALSLIWTVAPAPATAVALFAVLASEYSLAFGALGLLGALVSVPRAWIGDRRALVPCVLGLAAAGLATFEVAQEHHLAAQMGVSLDWSEFLGLTQQAPVGPESVVFASVNGIQLQLDVYRPRNASTAPRSVVVIHGGSWSRGRRSELRKHDRWLARQGFAVFDVDYRLEPAPNFFSAIGDVKCAIGWVQRHGVEYGGATDSIFLIGRSAGAHLALLAAYAADDPDLPSSCEAPAAAIAGVIAFYAPTDLAWDYDHPANQRVIDGPRTLERFLGGTPATAAAVFRSGSPVAHVRGNSPPTLLLQGNEDQFVRAENSERLAEKLLDAGVPYRAVYFPYGQHGFDYLPGLSSQVADALILEFLRDPRVQRAKPAFSR